MLLLFCESQWNTVSQVKRFQVCRKQLRLQKLFFFTSNILHRSTYPQGSPHGSRKISKIFFEKSMKQKRKIYEKVVPHFLELIGFIHIKTTVSKKEKTWCKRFWKKFFLARDINKTIGRTKSRNHKYLGLGCIFLKTARITIFLFSRRSFWCI